MILVLTKLLLYTSCITNLSYEFGVLPRDSRSQQSSKKRVRHARMFLLLGQHDLYMSWPAYRELGYRHTCRTAKELGLKVLESTFEHKKDA